MEALDIGIRRYILLGEQTRKRAKALEDELRRCGTDFDAIV
jgi:hypothetical protein